MPAARCLACLGVLAAALGVPCQGRAQTTSQFWTNVTLDWAASRPVTLGVNVEPKVLLSDPSGDPGWTTIDVTPSFEYAHGAWLDVLGEMLMGRTHQTDDLDSTELTPRIGLRLHLFANLGRELVRERRPMRRLVLRDLLRVEWRNLHYSTDKPDSSSVRLRNRFEGLWAINRPRTTDDGASYLTADWEWFMPLDDPDERFANRQRIRAGLGYRHSFAWRMEARYVWNRSRNTLDEPFTTTDHVVELTIKRAW